MHDICYHNNFLFPIDTFVFPLYSLTLKSYFFPYILNSPPFQPSFYYFILLQHIAQKSKHYYFSYSYGKTQVNAWHNHTSQSSKLTYRVYSQIRAQEKRTIKPTKLTSTNPVANGTN